MRTIQVIVTAAVFAVILGCSSSQDKKTTDGDTTPKTDPPPTEAKKPGKTKVIATEFSSPFKDKEWKPNSYTFGQDCSYPTESGEKKNWGLHLGEDDNVDAGTPVCAIGDGKVSYAKNHPGKSKDARNWGGVVIMGHWISGTEAIYSLCGHIKLDPHLREGEIVKRGHLLGTVAPALTLENGWWEETHLHLQIIIDPDDVYRGGILRGYAHDKAPNRLKDCIAPTEFFKRRKEGHKY